MTIVEGNKIMDLSLEFCQYAFSKGGFSRFLKSAGFAEENTFPIGSVSGLGSRLFEKTHAYFACDAVRSLSQNQWIRNGERRIIESNLSKIAEVKLRKLLGFAGYSSSFVHMMLFVAKVKKI